MKLSKARRPLFERLQAGLEEGIRHAKGDLVLKTTVLPERPPQIAAADLTALRVGCEMSQAVFARLLNVSTRTVQSWEQGTRKPSQAALRLIQVFRVDPSGVLQVVGMMGHPAGEGPVKPAARSGSLAEKRGVRSSGTRKP